MTTEATGVHLQLVNPAHTSQTCSHCGAFHKPRSRILTEVCEANPFPPSADVKISLRGKQNRNSEIFKCRNCGYSEDADHNASLNILNLGLAQQVMVAGST